MSAMIRLRASMSAAAGRSKHFDGEVGREPRDRLPAIRMRIDPGQGFDNEFVINLAWQPPEFREQPLLKLADRLAITDVHLPPQVRHIGRDDRTSPGSHEASELFARVRIEPEMPPAEPECIGPVGEEAPDGIAESAALVDLNDGRPWPGDADQLPAGLLPILHMLKELRDDHGIEVLVGIGEAADIAGCGTGIEDQARVWEQSARDQPENKAIEPTSPRSIPGECR